MPVFAIAALLLLGASPAAYGSSIASWWVDTDEDYSPQLFKYNATTEKIYGSVCNSVTTPIFAQDSTTALDLDILPRTGTSIASLGYLSDDNALIAYVFYLADKDSDGTTVASASFACDNTTGLWTPSAIDSASSHNEYISDTTNCAATAPAILENSGLAALYLNAGDGMRVFFKTAEFQTHYLQYTTSGQCTGWSYVGIASNLTTGNEVSAAFLKTKSHVWTIAQTVFANQSALADTSGEVEISTSNAHDTEDLWSINRMPTQIIAELKSDNSTAGILTNMSTTADSDYNYEHTDSWDFTFDSFSGSDARVGVAVDSGGIPSVFYVGTDGYLRRFASDTQGHWHEDDSEDASKWPVALNGSADFGIAYDANGNRIWIYYHTVDEEIMSQMYQSGSSTWDKFTKLSTSSNSSSSSTNSTSTSSTPSTSSSTGLASNAKVGLGVGLGLGIPLAAAALASCFVFRRRKQSRLAKRQRLESQYLNSNSHPNSPHSDSPVTPTTATTLSGPDQNQGYWQDGMWVEKSATAYYPGGPGANHMPREQLGELPTKAPVFEMSGDSVAHEMAAAGEHRK